MENTWLGLHSHQDLQRCLNIFNHNNIPFRLYNPKSLYIVVVTEDSEIVFDNGKQVAIYVVDKKGKKGMTYYEY